MSKEPRTHDDGRNDKQRAQQAREQEMEHERSQQRDQRTQEVDEERSRSRKMTPGGTDRPDGAQLREDATPRQRIAYEKDEPGFVERMAEEKQRPDFIERTLPEDPSDHFGQLTRDNVNPDIPSSKTREGGIADPNTLKMDQSQQGEQPPQAENQPEQWPQHQKVPSVSEYDKGEEGQQPKGKTAPREGEAPPIEPLRTASINEPPGSNVLPGDGAGPNQLPGDGTALPPGTELPELTLTDIDPDRIPVQPEAITETSLTVTGIGLHQCVRGAVRRRGSADHVVSTQTQLKANVPIAPAEGAYDVEVQRGEDLSDVLVFEIVPPRRVWRPVGQAREAKAQAEEERAGEQAGEEEQRQALGETAMGIPVVIKASGGMPVTVAANGRGTPMEVAANGYGLAVTQVANGLPVVGLAGGGTSAQVSQFLSRTTGLDATHTNAYTALIDGLVADGVWTKLDALYVFATQNTTNALLNLKSASYTPTVAGTLTFTADDGYKLSGGGTSYINTNFNASTAGGNYTQNSAHLSVWIFSTDAILGGGIGTASGANQQYVFENYGGGGTAYYRINCTDGGVNGAVASGVGHALGNRSSASAMQGYRNGVSIISGSSTSTGMNNSNFTFPNLRDGETDDGVCSGGSIGGSLTAGEVTSLYNRLRTYMTAVGVP